MLLSVQNYLKNLKDTKIRVSSRISSRTQLLGTFHGCRNKAKIFEMGGQLTIYNRCDFPINIGLSHINLERYRNEIAPGDMITIATSRVWYTIVVQEDVVNNRFTDGQVAAEIARSSLFIVGTAALTVGGAVGGASMAGAVAGRIGAAVSGALAGGSALTGGTGMAVGHLLGTGGALEYPVIAHKSHGWYCADACIEVTCEIEPRQTGSDIRYINVTKGDKDYFDELKKNA
jgi:hypothetical protein